jgi:mannose-6-phosphate isomerase-like protein (cupin superfamily)
MIHQILSRIDQQLLATVIRPDPKIMRENAGNDEEILQVSVLSLPNGRHLQSHRHLPVTRSTIGTAEAWIIVAGALQTQVFDLDQTPVESVDLAAGDCFVLYRGGHGFLVTSDSAVFYEIKNGPYFGSQLDLEKF